MGIRLRYSPTITRDTTTHTKNKILALKVKQDWFLSNIEHATTWDVALLDRTSGGNEGTLRDSVTVMTTKKVLKRSSL